MNIKYYTTNYVNFYSFRRICNGSNNINPHIDFNKNLGSTRIASKIALLFLKSFPIKIYTLLHVFEPIVEALLPL